MAVVTAVIGGRYAYRAVNWITLAPTSLLLAFQGDEVHPATVELFRRYQNGNLDIEEAKRMFDAVVGTPQIEIQSPAPAAAELKVMFCPHLRIPGGPDGQGWHLFFDQWRVCVNGKPIDDRRISYPNACGWVGAGSRSVWSGYTYPSPGVGRHRVTLDTIIALTPRTGSDRDSATVLHTWHLQASADLLVEDRPAETLVRAVYTPQLWAETVERLGVYVSRPPDYYFTCDSLPVPVVGDLFVRPSGEMRYEHLHPVCLPRGVGWSEAIHLRRLPGIGPHTHIDLCIVPDVMGAFERGCDEYFGKVIEILRVPIDHESLPWRARLSEAASEIRILEPGDPATQPATTMPSAQQAEATPGSESSRP